VREPDPAHRRFAGRYRRTLISADSCRETSCIDPGTSSGIMGPERGGLQERGQIGRCSVSQGLHRIGGELLHSLGQRNRQRARPELFRPFAMLQPAVTEGVRVRSDYPYQRNEPDFDRCRFQQPQDLPAVFRRRARHEAIGRRNR
jgi:hypothetical protein